MDDAELVALAARARDGDVAARNRIVEAHVHLVDRVSVRFFRGARRGSRLGNACPREDIRQICALELVRAAAKWPGRGSFEAYAVVAMRNAVPEDLARASRPRYVRPEACDVLATWDRPSPLAAIVEAEELSRLRRALAGLDERERGLLARRRGLWGWPALHIEAVAWWYCRTPSATAAACAALEGRLRAAVEGRGVRHGGD